MGGGGGERVKARPRIPPEKDRRDRGPLPENNGVGETEVRIRRVLWGQIEVSVSNWILASCQQ